MARASPLSFLAVVALTVFATIINAACARNIAEQDQGSSESNILDRDRDHEDHGYGSGYGYGYGYGGYDGAHDVAGDYAP